MKTPMIVTNTEDGLKQTKDEALCIDRNYHKGMDNHGQRTLVMCDSGPGRKTQIRDNTAPLRANTGAGHNNTIIVSPCIRSEHHNTDDVHFIQQKGRGFNKGGKKDISPPLTSNAFEHNNHIITHENKSGNKTDHDKACALRSGASHNYQTVNRIRRLTPVECARLQGFPDDWCKGLSDTQAYKCYGNSVSVPVVRAIAERIKEVLI